jgi:hypothetical protein
MSVQNLFFFSTTVRFFCSTFVFQCFMFVFFLCEFLCVVVIVCSPVRMCVCIV